MPRGKAVLSIAQLESLLSDKKSAIQKLNKERATLQKKIDGIDREIAKLGGSAVARKSGGRVRNEQSLIAVMQSVLQGKDAMAVGDIVAGVKSKGYQSKSANFRGIVNQTLIKERKLFTSPGRGMYHLKK